MLGGGHALKLGLLTFNMAVFFVTSMVDVILQVPNADLDYVRTLRAGECRVLLEARIFGTLGSAFDIMRQNAAIGWMMLTMIEGMVRGEGGIGRLLVDQEKHFNLASIFAIQLVFVSVGIGQDIFIGWLKGIVAPYSTLAYTKQK
jgi:NitT/TauT family transport system permease protein